MANLAGGDELGHRANRVLDRRRRVDAVLVVEVDVVDTEARERGVAGPAHVGGAAVDRARRRVAIEADAELGRQEDLVAAPGDRRSDEALIGVRPVHVGGVEEVAAEVERAGDRGARLAIVALAVERRHAHAAESERGNGGTVGPERARLHAICSSRSSGASRTGR